jgi:hypothetical protein
MRKARECGLWWYKAGMFRWILLAALLVGCSQAAPERDVKAEKRAHRLEAARTAAAQLPKRTVYRFDDGELVVLDIATVVDGGFADTQKCFLWRDTQMGTASLQCPASASADLPDIQ